jgi:5'-deoxynucleotidase YfbR-like HD superfamily hydrolase
MTKPFSPQQYQKAHDYLLSLGELSVEFARVERAPRYKDGRRESDVEHSYHLALSAVELAADLYPELDTGLVAQYALIHDLPEVYAGDVWTFHVTEEELERKREAEAQATARLMTELPPHLAALLERYEQQTEPEARFVRFVDKILPAIINIVAREASTIGEDHQITSAAQDRAARVVHFDRLQKMFPEFDDLYQIAQDIWETHTKNFFETTEKERE